MNTAQQSLLDTAEQKVTDYESSVDHFLTWSLQNEGYVTYLVRDLGALHAARLRVATIKEVLRAGGEQV